MISSLPHIFRDDFLSTLGWLVVGWLLVVGCWLDYASELSARDAVRQRPPACERLGIHLGNHPIGIMSQILMLCS